MTERYILIDAPGTYGDYATVHESHATLTAAIAAAHKRGGNRIVVVSDGGFGEHHTPGARIHRAYVGGYPVLWSPRIAAERAETAKAARAAAKWRAAYEEAASDLADRYGRGSGQYFAALDNWAQEHDAATIGTVAK